MRSTWIEGEARQSIGANAARKFQVESVTRDANAVHTKHSTGRSSYEQQLPTAETCSASSQLHRPARRAPSCPGTPVRARRRPGWAATAVRLRRAMGACHEFGSLARSCGMRPVFRTKRRSSTLLGSTAGRNRQTNKGRPSTARRAISAARMGCTTSSSRLSSSARRRSLISCASKHAQASTS